MVNILTGEACAVLDSNPGKINGGARKGIYPKGVKPQAICEWG